MRLIAVILVVLTHTRHPFETGVAHFVLYNIPKFGTAILSIISGYLFWTNSKQSDRLLANKVRSLLIPYLIANGTVLGLSLVLQYVFGYDILNRLSFDYKLITEGILSLNSPPINPPTYFIRDIFIIFSIYSLIRWRKWVTLIYLVPLAIFGHLVLRIDVVILFAVGCLIGQFESTLSRNKIKFILYIALLIVSVICIIWFNDYAKFIISPFVFVLMLNLKINFPKIAGYAYILHLYHSPIMVAIFPLLSLYVTDPLFNVILQILFALFFAFLFYKIIHRFKPLLVLSGGR